MLEQFTLVRKHGSKSWTVLHDCGALRSEHRAVFKQARGSGHRHPEYAEIKVARVVRKLRLDPTRVVKVVSANGHPAAPVEPKVESILPVEDMPKPAENKPEPKKRGKKKTATSSLASRLLGT